MTTYHRLLLLTTLGSALLTFCLMQTGTIDAGNPQHISPQQLQSMPQPQATEYYALAQPRMMTLAWQNCGSVACQPRFASQGQSFARQSSEIGI